MDNLDDSENNAKISDSAYSNSCSNSQSRRSHSSKSTHSGSNSSGSSGYGGKPSTSGSSNNLQPPKKDKAPKKKKQLPTEVQVAEVTVEIEVRSSEPVLNFDTLQEEPNDVVTQPPPPLALADNVVEHMDVSASERNSVADEVVANTIPLGNTTQNFVANRTTSTYSSDGFSCVVSMHDGVVMYTTSSLTTTLGFPKEMWIGRSFIDFVHTRDRSTLASQITSGLAIPKIVNGTQEKAQSPANTVSTMVCRIRRYRGLASGFGIKDRVVAYLPFLLKLTFKNISDEEGKAIYLVIQASPFFSAFKSPNEIVVKAVPFVMRHAANGHIEYIDPESVPYLGYLPQDLSGKDALQLYHPEDLVYLRQVYETIVKEGGLPRSKPYRMITQNGDYLKLETEWSSFINPWSRKLEFVIGKHHIIEGPANPDVFQIAPQEKAKVEDEKAQILRENIVRTMNEVLTKPAEVAKQQMTKRCEDLASFMESLMEETPKTEEELRLDIQDPDNSYYERDSVMLGGISPHHEYNDSKSSTETPLSYNQLNYHETLQRYFDNHQPYLYGDYNTAAEENILALKEAAEIKHRLSPMAQHSGDSGGFSSSDSNAMVTGGEADCPMPPPDFQPPLRLTENALNKHNADMEKELMKLRRETRVSNKGEREKATNATRQKKKEHLARCNASFQPTSVGTTVDMISVKPHGVKRASKPIESEAGAHKHHCPSPRQTRRRQRTSSTCALAQSSVTTTTTTVAQSGACQWPAPPVSNMNRFILGVGIPQQMSVMSPVTGVPGMPAVPGMIPMYYAPAPLPANTEVSTVVNSQFQPQPVQCMMYGQPMYGSPFMYSPLSQQMTYPTQQTMIAQSMQYTNSMNPLGLTSSNYEEACKPNLMVRTSKIGATWRDKKRVESQAAKNNQCAGDSGSSLNRVLGEPNSQSGNAKATINCPGLRSSTNCNSIQSTEAMPESSTSNNSRNNMIRLGNSEEAIDKTDGESSYSSFYSSFFKTESGSAEESGEGKKIEGNKNMRNSSVPRSYFEPQVVKKVARRKMDPPWMEQVCVTSDLIYKYQVLTKTMDEVLKADKIKMTTYEQPSLVNEQLGQLYLDLQLEGVASRLTLEEGITSSSSSGEETSIKSKGPRRKREYSKLGMFFEEDAPMPPPPIAEVDAQAETSTQAKIKAKIPVTVAS